MLKQWPALVGHRWCNFLIATLCLVLLQLL